MHLGFHTSSLVTRFHQSRQITGQVIGWNGSESCHVPTVERSRQSRQWMNDHLTSCFHLLLSGLRCGERPRWHDGKLWFSDFYRHAGTAIGFGLVARRFTTHCEYDGSPAPSLGRQFTNRICKRIPEILVDNSAGNTRLIRVDHDHSVHEATNDVRFPNRIVFLDSGRNRHPATKRLFLRFRRQ